MTDLIHFLAALAPAGMSGADLLLVLAAALVAGLARGFSGFGGALIYIPIASAVIEPKLASAVLLMADGVTTLTLIPQAARSAERRNAFIMAAGALGGVPLGTFALLHVDPVLLRWAISIIVIALLGLIISGWRFAGKPKAILTVGVGFISGIFSGAAQVGGPPVVAYFLGGQMPGLSVRANIIFYFAISTLISTASYFYGGLLTRQAVWLALLTAPIFSLGLYAGARLFGKASENVFRLACYGLIAASAIAGLPLFDRLH